MAAAGGEPSPEEMPLDAEMLKVLAADSRRDILRLLQKRRMTLTELSSALDLKKATVLEHLQKLVAVGLIRRHEDERLWVYYELTPRGGRLVTPGKTRFYLVMAGIAAAALLMGSIAAVALLRDPGPDHALPLSLRSEPVAGGFVLSLDLDFEGEPAGLTAWLLTPDEARRLADGEDVVLTRRLGVTPIAGGIRVQSMADVPSGGWVLYVQTADGADNRDSLVPVHLPRLEATGPTAVTQGLDEPRFVVLRDGEPAAGEVRLLGPSGVLTLPLASGAAVLDGATLDALRPGAYALSLRPEGTATTVSLGLTVTVREARLVLTPLQVAEGRPTALNLSLAGGLGAAPDVRLMGASLDVTPDAEGKGYDVGLPGLPPGEVEVQIGRLHEKVQVHADPLLSLQARDETTFDLSVRDPDGSPREGVQVHLDGDTLGSTDAGGLLRFRAPTEGNVSLLRLEDKDGAVVRAFAFDGGRVAEAPGALAVKDVAQSGGRATARVVNEGPAPVALTVTATLAGTPIDAVALTLDPGADAPVAFDLGSGQAGALDVRAEALRRAPVTFVPVAGEPIDASAPPASTSRVLHFQGATPVATTPTVTVPVTTTPSFGASATPAPEVPFPWPLVLAALAFVALAGRRRRRG